LSTNITTAATFPSYLPMGEQVVIVQFEHVLSVEVNQRVQSFANVIKNHQISGVNQLIPAFNSLAICYDPMVIDYNNLVNILRSLEGSVTEETKTNSSVIHVPVAYGGTYGPDLEDVARQTDLTTEEVIKIHHSNPYLVYMVGFIAGFPYCGDIDDRLVLPRRSSPRLKVVKGSVCIANKQTGMYTMTSPGGWHLIGWTPVQTFNPYHDPPSMLKGGDFIQFLPISAQEAEKWDEHRQREWDLEWNSLR
jgi:inhibitor of KinA